MSESYFKSAHSLLVDFQWIFRSSNTEYIANRILDHFPPDWISSMTAMTNDELNNLPFGYVNNEWPVSLKQFLLRVNALQSVIAVDLLDCMPYTTKMIGISPKKLHEISKLSTEIDSNIHRTGGTTNTILVDLGCGLGYLSQMLNERYGYRVLGIEANAERVKTAKQRQLKQFPSSVGSVQYVQHFVNSDCSIAFIRSELQRFYGSIGNVRLALIGLHACADLTVTALQLYLNMSDVQTIIIMPCCYHKMQLRLNGGGGFENIPISARMRNSADWDQVLSRPYLRLASQQTAARWRSLTAQVHAEHGRNMYRRAIVQTVLLEGERAVKQRKQLQSDEQNWYLEYQIIHKATNSTRPWSPQRVNRLNACFRENQNGEKLSEVLTGLQAVIQAVCEYVVLLDKVCYVEESSVESNVQIKKIMKEELSPRCFVLICNKNC